MAAMAPPPNADNPIRSIRYHLRRRRIAPSGSPSSRSIRRASRSKTVRSASLNEGFTNNNARSKYSFCVFRTSMICLLVPRIICMRFPSPVFLFGFSLCRRILLYSVFVFLVLFSENKKTGFRPKDTFCGQSFATYGRFFRQFIHCVEPG